MSEPIDKSLGIAVNGAIDIADKYAAYEAALSPPDADDDHIADAGGAGAQRVDH